MNRVAVPSFLEGKRLDRALAELRPELTRAAWKKRLDKGLVRLNDGVAKGSEKVVEGDEIRWEEEQEEVSTLPYPVSLDIPVIYEDEEIAIIIKPAGLTVHPGQKGDEVTLAHGLLHRFSNLSTVGGEHRPGIVHRLDKETAGLMVIAKTDRAYRSLQHDFVHRKVYKGYEAIVHNRLAEGMHIVDPLGRHPVQRTRMAVVAEGREALTYVKPLAYVENFTHVEVEIVTGRTHQIRVHLSHHGYPIVGDRVYGPRKPVAKELLLAATALRFSHPQTREDVSFTASIPAYMEQFLDLHRGR